MDDKEHFAVVNYRIQLINQLSTIEQEQRRFAEAMKGVDAAVADTATKVAAGVLMARDAISEVPF